MSAGCQYNLSGTHGLNLSVTLEEHPPRWFNLPDLGLWFINRAAPSKSRNQIGTRAVLITKNRTCRGGGNGFDCAPDLTSWCRLLIDHQNAKAKLPQADSRAHACGTCADYDHIKFTRHAVTLRRPYWRSTCMPSCTVTRQDCVEATPSMTARQSKQTPIMQ
ncbi:hypothetical protein D3C75_665330 [compost metagenome]